MDRVRITLWNISSNCTECHRAINRFQRITLV